MSHTELKLLCDLLVTPFIQVTQADDLRIPLSQCPNRSAHRRTQLADKQCFFG